MHCVSIGHMRSFFTFRGFYWSARTVSGQTELFRKWLFLHHMFIDYDHTYCLIEGRKMHKIIFGVGKSKMWRKTRIYTCIYTGLHFYIHDIKNELRHPHSYYNWRDSINYLGAIRILQWDELRTLLTSNGEGSNFTAIFKFHSFHYHQSTSS